MLDFVCPLYSSASHYVYMLSVLTQTVILSLQVILLITKLFYLSLLVFDMWGSRATLHIICKATVAFISHMNNLSYSRIGYIKSLLTEPNASSVDSISILSEFLP